MTNTELARLYGLNSPDNKILENSRVHAWLEKLEKEFAVEHNKEKTRETYRHAIIRFTRSGGELLIIQTPPVITG